MKKKDNVISFKVVRNVNQNEPEDKTVKVNKHESIIEYLESQLEHLKNNPSTLTQKAMLVLCFGEENEEDDWDYFQYSAFNISPKDFLYLAEKIKLQYITNI